MAVAVAILASFQLKVAAQESSDSLLKRQLTDYGIRFTNGNRAKLLTSGQQKFDDMFETIRQARHSIHLEYFNFRNDSIASLLFDLLRQKRREGVEVRALFDGFGNDSNNQPLKKHHLKALRNDSIDIREFDPIRFPWVNHLWPRDHRKIVVIDGCVAYTGGMNVADYYINGTEELGEWRDMHCRIDGPAINQLQLIFMRVWKKVTGETVTGEEYFYPTRADGRLEHFKLSEPTTSNAQIGIINREPGTHRTDDGQLLGRNNAMRRLYVWSIDSARDSIKIINPYFTLLPSVRKALKRALKRGVKLEIMVSVKCDEPLTPDVVLRNVHKLMKKGAIVWYYQPGFHHSKVMMVDGRMCTVGSTNLDARSLRFDYEENALFLDRDMTHALEEVFTRDTKKSERLTQESWKRMSTFRRKLSGTIGYLLQPVL